MGVGMLSMGPTCGRGRYVLGALPLYKVRLGWVELIFC